LAKAATAVAVTMFVLWFALMLMLDGTGASDFGVAYFGAALIAAVFWLCVKAALNGLSEIISQLRRLNGDNPNSAAATVPKYIDAPARGSNDLSATTESPVRS